MSELSIDHLPGWGMAAGAYYLADEMRSIGDWARAAGGQAADLLGPMRANGLASYRVCGDMSALDLAERAVARMLEGARLVPADVDLVIYCHTESTSVIAAPASIPAALARRFGMARAQTFSIAQQKCVSIVCALRLLPALLARRPRLRNVLVVSADKAIEEARRNVSTYAIQSDGALALWIARDEPRNRIGPVSFVSVPEYFRGAAKSAQLTQRFSLNYPLVASRLIRAVVDAAGWQPAEVDAILPMNANVSAFRRVMELVGLPEERLYTANIGAVGHVFCCDPFINFIDRFCAGDVPARGGNAILYSSGSAGCFAGLGIAGVAPLRRTSPTSFALEPLID